jgi:hypothetical protein
MVSLTQTVQLSCVKISTILKWTELSLEPRHLGLPSGASKMISKPMVCLAQTVHLPAPTLTLPPNRKKRDSTWPKSPRVPSGPSKIFSEPMVCSTQMVHLSCIKISTVSKWTKLSLEPCHLGVPSGLSKTISESMVRLAQTVDLSCTDTNTISKRKEVRFHMTHITEEYHQVRPKRFPCLWYVQHKSCTYLLSRLALSLNGPSFHLSLVTSMYHQVHPKWFLSRWYIWHKLCTYLAPTLFPNRTKRDSHDWHHLGVPSGASKTFSEPIEYSTQTVH